MVGVAGVDGNDFKVGRCCFIPGLDGVAPRGELVPEDEFEDDVDDGVPVLADVPFAFVFAFAQQTRSHPHSLTPGPDPSPQSHFAPEREPERRKNFDPSLQSHFTPMAFRP